MLISENFDKANAEIVSGAVEKPVMNVMTATVITADCECTLGGCM